MFAVISADLVSKNNRFNALCLTSFVDFFFFLALEKDQNSIETK